MTVPGPPSSPAPPSPPLPPAPPTRGGDEPPVPPPPVPGGGDGAAVPAAPLAGGPTAASRLRRFLVGQAGPGPCLALAVIALLAAFLATAGPREVTSMQNKALRQTLAQQTGGFGITAASSWQVTGSGPPVTAAQIQTMSGVMASYLRPPLVSPAWQRWAGLTTQLFGVLNPEPRAVLGGPPKLEIAYRTALAGNARLISGTLPRFATPTHLPFPLHTGQHAITLQAAVTAATARTFGLRPGSLVRLGRTPSMPASDPPILLSITGVLRPTGPSSTFWTTDPLLAAPSLYKPLNGPTLWFGGVLIGPDELPALQAAAVGASTAITWDFPLDTGGLTASQAPGMLAAMTSMTSGNAGEAALQATAAGQPGGPLGGASPLQNPPTLTANGTGVLSAFIAGQAAVGTTEALLLGGVAATTAILLLIGAAAVADAFRVELALARARGGSTGQIAGRVLGATAGAAGPALVVGIALAIVVVPDGGNTTGWVLAAIAAVIALTAPALLAAWQHRGLRSLAGTGRADLAVPRRSARRLVAESTAIVVVVGGVVALRVRGLAPGTGVDPYLVAAPVLIAVAAGLIAARAYPVPLRAVARVMAARRGTVGFLGVARSARARSVPLLPALALVVAMAVIALGGMVRAAVTSGQVTASWQQVGADAVVAAAGASTSISPAAQAALATAPGVRRASAVFLIPSGTSEAGNLLVGTTGAMPTGVIIVDPAQYAALVADTPWPAFPARLLAAPPAGQRGRTVPVIASPNVAATIRRGSRQLAFGGSQLTLRVAATASSTPALPGGGSFIILPAWVRSRLVGSAAPNTMLLTGADIDGRALRAVVARALPGGQITSRAAVLQAAAGSPVVHGSDLALEEAAGAAAACAVAAVLLGVLLAGRDRTGLGVWLTAMGMTARQARRLALLDALPLLLVAILGGELASLALGPLIGPGLDLSAFTGSSAPVSLRPDLVALITPAAGALILIMVAAAAQNALIRRRSGAVLRLDEGR
jgi:putative ABC transport system permease protein